VNARECVDPSFSRVGFSSDQTPEKGKGAGKARTDPSWELSWFRGCAIVGWVQKARAGRGCEARQGDKKGAVVCVPLPDWAFLEQPCHNCKRGTAERVTVTKGLSQCKLFV
jgi:hypothetical protein